MRNRPLYAFDAEVDTMDRWHEVSAQVAEELKAGKITPLFEVNGENGIQYTDLAAVETG